ncbi:MAG TPA: helix-hairpin-helix domain-containing protein [Thermoleophilaceae bacterium]|jgi:competence protein ComEA
MLEDIDKGKLVTWAALGLLVLAIALRLHGHGGGGTPPAAAVSLAPASGARAPVATVRELWVDVAGAVRRPGLYKVPSGSRLAIALERAGGVSARGDEAGVNLAAPLHDGQQVIVPRRGAAAVVAGGTAAAAGSASAGPISLGQATEVQLESLDGIGPALAGRILEYRQQHGGFRSLDELKEVSGIGDKRFEALRRSLVP